MPLIKRPLRPQWTPFSTEMFSLKRYREWMPFLTTVDTAYWNTELLPDLALRKTASGASVCAWKIRTASVVLAKSNQYAMEPHSDVLVDRCDLRPVG